MAPKIEKDDEYMKTVNMKNKFTEKLKGTLIYPSDSAGDAFYPEAIKFTVYRRKGASLKKIMDNLGDIGATVQQATGLGDVDSEKKIDEMISANNANMAKMHKDDPEANRKEIKKIAERNKFLREIQAGDSNATLAGVLKHSGDKIGGIIAESTSGLNQTAFKTLEKETSSQLREIYLNMPNEISFNEAADWTGTDLGMIGGMVKGEGKEAALGGLFSNFANIVGGGTSALATLAAGFGGQTAMAAGMIGMLGGTSVQKSLESGTGQVANPYKEMTFNGIGFREFTFNFTFRARNQPEVATIQDIIRTFRHYSKPVYTAGESGFFSYPEEFHIEFLTKTNTQSTNETDFENFTNNPYIPQIKMCVCKSVTTNFAAQNAWRSLADGAPAEISLGLTFEETELVTGEDVLGETKVGRFKGTERSF